MSKVIKSIVSAIWGQSYCRLGIAAPITSREIN